MGRRQMTSGAEVVDQRYLSEEPDRHGNMRLYFRRRIPGSKKVRKIRLREKQDTPEFYEEFAAALAGRPYEKAGTPRPKPPPRVVPNSLRWLTTEYYRRSLVFKSYDGSTKSVRRNILRALCEELVDLDDPAKGQIGDLPYDIPEEKIILLMERKDTVDGANSRLKALRQLFGWASSIKPKLVARNIAADLPLMKRVKTGGWHTWTIEEIQQYGRRHPVGSKAFLVLMMFLLTGQRISDVAKLGKQHIRKPEHVSAKLRELHAGRWLAFTQHKNRNKAPVSLTIPMLPYLEKVVAASPVGDLTFIETEFGKGHSTKGLGNWFADRCVEAKVPGRAHGLRKAGATIAAENGATPHQLMAIFGWKTLAQAEVYTAKVRQQMMAGGSMHMIAFDQIGNECVPPADAVPFGGTLEG
jgi:integrase